MACFLILHTHTRTKLYHWLFHGHCPSEVFQTSKARVPSGSPSRGGDVKVCVLDINQPSLTTPFTLFLCLFLSYGPFTCISLHKSSRQLSAFSSRSRELRTQKLKVPSGENTELKRSPFQSWSRSVYSHTCYAYCQGVLPCLFLPFQSIHLHFFQNLSQFFSCAGLQNKIGHPAGCRFPC